MPLKVQARTKEATWLQQSHTTRTLSAAQYEFKLHLHHVRMYCKIMLSEIVVMIRTILGPIS